MGVFKFCSFLLTGNYFCFCFILSHVSSFNFICSCIFNHCVSLYMMGSCLLFNRGSFILLNIIHTGCVKAVVKLSQKRYLCFFVCLLFLVWGLGWLVTLCVNMRRK